MIVEGQVHGGVVQGIGQALWEEAVYDDNGQLLTGSLADYAIPRADMLPRHRSALDGHAVAASSAWRQRASAKPARSRRPCTVYNAVIDALEPFGVESIQMPLTPERVWRAMQRDREGSVAMYCTSTSTTTARAPLADAQQLLAAHPGAKLLAGGHSLIPLLKLRLAAPSAVIDIGRIASCAASPAGRHVRIGALTTHAELAASADLRAVAPALADAAAMVGDPAVRNRGTIGGNVAHADPASDLPTVLVALDARIDCRGAEGRARRLRRTSSSPGS